MSSKYSISTSIGKRDTTISSITQALSEIRDYAETIEKKAGASNGFYVFLALIGSGFGLFLLITISKALFPVFRGILSTFIILFSWGGSLSKMTTPTPWGNLVTLAIDSAGIHARTLIEKRKKYLKQDDYGNWKSTKWAKEIDYFLNNTVYPRAKELNYDLHENNEQYLSKVYTSVELVTLLNILKEKA